jgi:hypothetical protein
MAEREVPVTLLLPDKATKRKSSGLSHTFRADVEHFGPVELPLATMRH